MVTDRRASPRRGEAKPRLVIVWFSLCPLDAVLGFDEHIVVCAHMCSIVFNNGVIV